MLEPRRQPWRPRRTPATKEKDEAIAKTAYRLLAAGWSGRSRPLKPGVFEVVGIEAGRILSRIDADRRGLGPDRIEQIYEEWRAAEQVRRRKSNAWPLLQISKWKVDSLRERAPFDVGNTLPEQAQALLLNGGEWPLNARFRRYLGDKVPTPKHAEWIAETMPRFAPPTSPSDEEIRAFAERLIAGALAAQKNGVEK